MIEQRGIMREGNPIIQYIILNYDTSDFILIKISFTAVILFLPFLILNKGAYWMIIGFLITFIIAGILGTVLNIQAARNEQLLLSPEQVIFFFITLVLILTNIGDEIDKRTHPKIRPYTVCLLNDIAIILFTVTSLLRRKNE